MIFMSLTQKNDCFKLSVRGHAHMAPHGQDIVCAAVSALCLSFSEYASLLAEKGQARIVKCAVSPGELTLCFFSHGKKAKAAAELLLCGARRIMEQYPDALSLQAKISRKRNFRKTISQGGKFNGE